MPAFGRDDDRGEANRSARKTTLETGAPEATSRSPLGRERDAKVRADLGCGMVSRSQAAGVADNRWSYRDSFGPAGFGHGTSGRHCNR